MWRLHFCIFNGIRCGEANKTRKEHSRMFWCALIWIKSSCARLGKACSHNVVDQRGKLGLCILVELWGRESSVSNEQRSKAFPAHMSKLNAFLKPDQ